MSKPEYFMQRGEIKRENIKLPHFRPRRMKKISLNLTSISNQKSTEKLSSNNVDLDASIRESTDK